MEGNSTPRCLRHTGLGPQSRYNRISSTVLRSQSVLCSAFYSLSKVAHELEVTHAPFVPREYISRHNGAHFQLRPQCFKNVTDFIVSDSPVCSEKTPHPQPQCCVSNLKGSSCCIHFYFWIVYFLRSSKVIFWVSEWAL